MAAPEFDERTLVRELEAAYADEVRALQLLAKTPPRRETAALALDRSRTRLREILKDSSLPTEVSQPIAGAHEFDQLAASALRNLRDPVSVNDMREQRERIEKALRLKDLAFGVVSTLGSTGGFQCADGRDNDGDQLVDAPYDSGCTTTKDESEGSPLTCTLGYAPAGGAYLVKGTCSGPFFKIEISGPQGVKFDTKRAPVVVQDRVCWASESRIDCVMGDGAANPHHVVNVRWWSPQAARRLKVKIIDFGGRGRTVTVSQKPDDPPAKPFTLGPGPVDVAATYTNGQGGCPVATNFTAAGQFLARGDGILTYTLPGNQVAKGPIDPKGSYKIGNASESYVGRITGNTATATYTYTTASGCTETYDFSAVLER